MAVLQKIRERSGLLIGATGVALFAFIIGDLFTGGMSFSSRNVGEVDGVSIRTNDYINKVHNAQQNGQNTTEVHNQIWGNEVRSILLNNQFEKLGLRLGKDQIIYLIQRLPDFQNPQFYNEAGQFDKGKFNAFLADIQKQGQNAWNGWLAYEKQLENFAKEEAYFNMIRGAVNTTALEAKRVYHNENDGVSFEFVKLGYETVKDEEVKVKDEEILNYIKKYASQFKADNSRSLEYVLIDNSPSEADLKAANNQINDLLQSSVSYNNLTKKNDTVAGFNRTANPVDFVNQHSDVPFDSTYLTKEQLPAEFADAIYGLAVGQSYGPYTEGNAIKVTRMLKKEAVADKVTASHILIAYKDAQSSTSTLTKEEAKAKADELLKQVQANSADFARIATENTDDPGSKATGGQYKDITKGYMVPQFDEFIFTKPTGSIGLVETVFGYHIIKVDGKQNAEKVQLATLVKNAEASAETEDKVHATATKLEEAIASKEFSKAAAELGLIAHPAASIGAFTEQLPAVGAQREAIQWAFGKDVKAGDYKRFSTAQGELIVKVKSINESGLVSVDDARALVEPILIRQKKAEILRKKMTGDTVEAVAKATKTNVEKVENATGVNSLVGGFQEPKVFGTALALDVNKISKLIEGKNGVYMVKTTAKNKATELPNYEGFKSRVLTNNANSVSSSVMNSLYQQAEIKDNRVKVLNQ